jgi:LysM repeat protein
LRLSRPLRAAACCACIPALLIAAACGGGSGGDSPSQARAGVTATLPATLPSPIAVGNGVIQNAGGSTYTVKSGDTLAGIAARFGVSLEDLRAANPSVNASSLSVGQSIKLPSGTSPNPTPAADTPGPAPTDTPPPPPPDTPTPEPQPTNTPSSLGQTYIVQSGDIPVSIAEKFGITVEELLAANPGLDPRAMHAGDVLIIPPAATPTG